MRDELSNRRKLARQVVTREKISELLELLVLRWARMSFFRGLWKSSSKHKSELSLIGWKARVCKGDQGKLGKYEFE